MSGRRVVELIGRLTEAKKGVSGETVEQKLRRLIEWERESGHGLNMIHTVGTIEDGERAIQKAFLLNFRGNARLSRYDIDGNHAVMIAGLDDHRKAVEVAKEFRLLPEMEGYQNSLAISLVRAGEQCGDIGMLREAHTLLKSSLNTDDPSKWPVSDHDLVNAFCVAILRLGDLTGDRALVVDAVHKLQVFWRRDGLSKEGKNQTMKNTVAALAENARQTSSIRVYEQTIRALKKIVKQEGGDVPFFLRYLASLSAELSFKKNDLKILKEAISLYKKSLGTSQIELAIRVSTLHDLSNALAFRGSANRSIGCLKEAISCNEEAVSIIENYRNNNDSRIIRLLGDRASCYEKIGWISSDERYSREAKKYHKKALSLVEKKNSPWLCGRIATGYFYHCYVQGHWEEAIDAFAEVEEAWGLVTIDPTLSSEIHDQRAVELAPHYARAALCRLATGAVSMASSVIDRGRAQQLTAASRVSPASLETQGNESDPGISQAVSELTLAQKQGDDEACRQAWRAYRNTLHQLGGHLNVLTRSPEELLEAAPHDGVFIQVFGTDGRLKAIVVDRSKPSFSEIALPNSAAAAISKVLRGDPEGDRLAWRDAYHQFRSGSEIEDTVLEENLFESWDETITHCLESIGSALMEPIHRFLQERGYPPGTAVILSPPGELASLPLNSMVLEDGALLSSHWNLSVVPNSAMLRPIDHPGSESSAHQMLIISEPFSENFGEQEQGFLGFAAAEIDRVASHVDTGLRRTIDEKSLNVPGVLEALEDCSIVHFACHGAQKLDKPDFSGLLLPGGDRLTLARLRATPQHGVTKRLAVLSCCETGIAGQTVPADEFVGLLPTLLQAGFQGAIGTIWPVYDDAAMCLMDRFYRLFLGNDGTEKCSPAEALARAQQWLRNVSLGELVDDGLFTRKQALDLADSRFAGVRLRIQPAGGGSREPQNLGDAGEEHGAILTSEPLKLQPFSSPVDWAAFILVGT